MTTTDASSLRLRLSLAGVFEFHTQRTACKFALLVAVGVGLFIAATQVGLGAAFVLLSLAAFPLTTAAMIGHEGVHRSFADNAWHNNLIAHLAFPILTGLGVRYWKHKHNANHHGNPNIDGKDDDLELWPMATSAEMHERSRPSLRFFQRYLQAWLFWPLTFFLSATMRFHSVGHLVKLARRGKIDRSWVADAACIALHYVVWLVIPSLIVGPVWALVSYLWMWALVGVFLSMIFTPAHLGLPIVSAGKGGWRHQLETTRNLRVPTWLSGFFVGLDFQVEHHLFPRIPHQNLPEAAAIVEQWCGEVGLPYHALDYSAAIVDATRFMGRAWSVPVTRPNPSPAT